MYLYSALLHREADREPVRVGLIGAGKFGSMFLSQAPTTPGLRVSAIADLDPDAATGALPGCRLGSTRDRRHRSSPTTRRQ